MQLAVAILLATGSAGDADMAAFAAQAHAPRATSRPSALAYSDDAWLAAIREHGAEVGLRDEPGRIFRTSTGRIYVPVAVDRQAILALRRDADLARRLATASARAAAVRLEVMLSRPATGPEVYLAHLVGTREASALIVAAAREPQRSAAEIAPAAALGHPELFFTDVRPRSASAVVTLATAAFERAAHAVRPVQPTHQPPPGPPHDTHPAESHSARASPGGAAAWRIAITPPGRVH